MKFSLIEFSLTNYNIFREKTTFSTISKKGEKSFEANGNHLLRTSVIYGPNASGKSTLLDGMNILLKMVFNSTNSTNEGLPYFRHSLGSDKLLPVIWEIAFSYGSKLYQYNFAILEDHISSEMLSRITKSGDEKVLFERNNQKIDIYHDFKGAQDIVSKTKPEYLFLSTANQWNNELAMSLVEGIRSLNVISGQHTGNYQGFTVKLVKEGGSRKEQIMTNLKKADFSITSASVQESRVPDQVREMLMKAAPDKSKVPKVIEDVFFKHEKFDDKGQSVGFHEFPRIKESEGTQAFFYMLGPILNTLENGNVLFIDEFDNSLHPKLTKYIVNLFENHNPNDAQLIVTTHDTSLLSEKKGLDKNQVWFTEKDRKGSATLFSLAEFKLRNDTEYSKKYLEGRFGALPFINFK